MQKLNNKRLYEECIVKSILEEMLVEALKRNISIDNVESFIESDFDQIVKKIIEHE